MAFGKPGLIVTLAGALLAAIGTTQAQTIDAPLVPAGKWIVQGENGECTLQRDFVQGDAPMTLAFRPDPLGKGVSFVILGKNTLPHGNLAGSIELSPGGQQFAASGLGDALANERASLTFNATNWSALSLDTLRAATVVRITTGRFSVAFAMTGLASAIKVLEDCNRLLIGHWGIDAQELAAIQTRAIPITSVATWIPASAYPDNSLAAGLQGSTKILFAITPDGRIADCRTVVSSGEARLDTQACRSFTRNGRFMPAKDALGHAVTSHQIERINWRVGS